jgi:hypothetical protein
MTNTTIAIKTNITGNIMKPSTYENVKIHSREDIGKVCVNIDFNGYYNVDQIDDLIGMLEQAKITASYELNRLNHKNLFDTTNEDITP